MSGGVVDFCAEAIVALSRDSSTAEGVCRVEVLTDVKKKTAGIPNAAAQSSTQIAILAGWFTGLPM
jgi:hypothetical protein